MFTFLNQRNIFMKKYLLTLSAVVLLGFTACKDTAKEASTEATTETSASPVVDDHAGHDHAGHGHDAPQATGNVNPPHGEPGHRCDIPTGAPLDSAPNTPAINVQPNASTQGGQPFLVNDDAKARMAQENGQTVPQGAKGSGQINPPHGQPGHRCDVPVGQAL